MGEFDGVYAKRKRKRGREKVGGWKIAGNESWKQNRAQAGDEKKFVWSRGLPVDEMVNRYCAGKAHTCIFVSA